MHYNGLIQAADTESQESSQPKRLRTEEFSAPDKQESVVSGGGGEEDEHLMCEQ